MWNPFEMLGYRFAADPQSGWLYAAADGDLFALLSPGVAMRAMIVLQPPPRGARPLRLPARGRDSGGSRPRPAGLVDRRRDGRERDRDRDAVRRHARVDDGTSCCVRGLPCAPNGGRVGSAGSPSAGFAWSQVASAHLSHGLVVATAGRRRVPGRADAGRRSLGRHGRVPRRPAGARPAGPRPTVPVPVGLEPRGGLRRASARTPAPDEDAEAPIAESGVWAGWPLAFGAAPGAYLGAATLARRAAGAPGSATATASPSPSLAVLGATWVAILPAVLESGVGPRTGAPVAVRRRRPAQPGALPVRGAHGAPGPRGLGDRRGRDRTAERAGRGGVGRGGGGALGRRPARRGRRPHEVAAVRGRAHPGVRPAAAGRAATGLGSRPRRPARGRARGGGGARRAGTPATSIRDRARGRLGHARPPAAARARRRRRRVPAADRARRRDRVRPLPHLGSAGGRLREGIPVRSGADRLAGPRERAGDAVPDPRRPRLQPGAAPVVLAVDPREEPAADALQRRGPRPPHRG